MLDLEDCHWSRYLLPPTRAKKSDASETPTAEGRREVAGDSKTAGAATRTRTHLPWPGGQWSHHGGKVANATRPEKKWGSPPRNPHHSVPRPSIPGARWVYSSRVHRESSLEREEWAQRNWSWSRSKTDRQRTMESSHHYTPTRVRTPLSGSCISHHTFLLSDTSKMKNPPEILRKGGGHDRCRGGEFVHALLKWDDVGVKDAWQGNRLTELNCSAYFFLFFLLIETHDK